MPLSLQQMVNTLYFCSNIANQIRLIIYEFNVAEF